MDKFRIMVVDDENLGTQIICRYIGLYFSDNSLFSVKEFSLAKLAIKEINDCQLPYDFIFTDLEFSSQEDTDSSGRQLSGKEVMITAASKYDRYYSCFFTVSGKLGTSKVKQLERELREENICFKSLLKDESVERIKKELDAQLRKWTTHILGLGISLSNKSKLLNLVNEKRFEQSIDVFGRPRQIKNVLIYWFNRNLEPKIEDIVRQFPNSFYDLPNISADKLFLNIGLSKDKFDSPLVDYYRYFYINHSTDLDELIKKAKHYLGELAIIYNSVSSVDANFRETNDEHTKKLHKELYSKIKREKIDVQGKLGQPSDELVLTKFMQRLWFRLFCIGAYFLRISEMDIFRLFATKYIAEREDVTEDNLKVFSRSLWLDHFSQKMDIFERNYIKIWESLTEYERVAVKEWWNDMKTLKNNELQPLFTIRELDKIESRVIH